MPKYIHIKTKEHIMKIEKKELRDAVVTTKLTKSQKEKIEELSKEYDITKSNLIAQLIEEGYKQATLKIL